MFQTKDILCSGVQVTRQGRVRRRRQLIIILVEQAAAQPAAEQPAAAEDAANAANAENAEKTPKKNDVEPSGGGLENINVGVEQAAVDAAAAPAGAKHALPPTQTHQTMLYQSPYFSPLIVLNKKTIDAMPSGQSH